MSHEDSAMNAAPDAPTVVRDDERSRYELRDGDSVAGVAVFELSEGGRIVFTHTEIDPGWEGQGVGGQLVRAALDDVRRQGLPVLPTCPFVQAWMQRHPDYADLDYRAPRSTATD